MANDKIEVGDAGSEAKEDADEKARSDLRLTGHVVGSQVAEYEGGEYGDQELKDEQQVRVHLNRTTGTNKLSTSVRIQKRPDPNGQLGSGSDP